MFKHYFNIAILYMCLFGEYKNTTLNNNERGRRVTDFVMLWNTSPNIDLKQKSPKNCINYFFGLIPIEKGGTGKQASSAGSGINSTTENNPDDTKKFCQEFYNKYPQFQSDYDKILLSALKMDGIQSNIINKVLDGINSNSDSWFFEVYMLAIGKPEGYFEGCKPAIEIYREIIQCYQTVYSEILDEYNQAKSTSDDSRNEVTSCEPVIDYYLLAKSWFNTQSSTGRYRGYGKSKGKRQIEEIKNKLDTADSEPHYLIDIIFDESDNTHSINLCGKGGSGKTFQILRAIETILADKPEVLPFYIPLSSLEFSDSKTNCIIEYLVKEIGFPCVDLTKKTLKKKGTNIILFADGLNEISDPTIRRKIAIDICQLRQKYKTRFLVSSRQDHTDLFNTLNYGEDKYFTKAEVLDLSEEQINEYFLKVKCKVMYENVSVPTRKLLHTPQGCVMYAELIGSDLENTMKIESLGRLLECYCNSILGVDSRSQFNDYEKPLMEIGYTMVLNGWFNISEEEIATLENVSYEDMRILFSDNSPTWSIFIRNKDGNYEFTHQNYRDLYCAKKFASLIKQISPKTLSHDLESIFVTNNITMNDEILELTSAFIGSGRTSIQSIIDIIRENVDNLTGKYEDNYDFPLSVLIRIYAFAHSNNISNLDLSELDLTEVCLNGYELFDRESDTGIELFDAKINYNTVLKVGFPTGSSAICTFENNDKTFIVAFDRTTAMIIDVEENQRQLIRNLPDYGWVNVAYPTTINEELCILLGCDSGKVAVFYPDRLEDDPKIFLFDTKVKSEDGIQSIIQVKQENKDYYLLSNTDGWIFVYDRSNDVLLEPISICDEQERQKVIEDWDKYNSKMIAACRMDYDKPNNQVLISFGNKIYRMILATDSFEITEYAIDWNYQTPRLIKDIKATQSYIFINEIDAISVIRNGIKTWEFVINQEKRLADREQFLRNVLRLDEAMIQEVIAAEKSITTVYGKKIKNFYFQKFSPIPDGLYRKEEGVLVGIKTPNESLYKQLPQFIEIKVRSSCKSIVKHNNITPIHTNQTLATHTGVYYSLKSMPSTVFLATTSDDRSVDLIAPHNEEFVPQHIEGAYNGVRDIEIIDESHFVCAQYDGSLILFSLIKAGNNKESSWKVTNVIKSHHNWVWKAEIYEKWSDESQKIVSCSYDGTVRVTDFCNSETSIPIIKASQPIRGVYRKGSHIWAFSPQSMYHASLSEGKWISDDAHDGKSLGIPKLNISSLADLGNDVPFVFYNTGMGTQGYIAAFSNHSELINKITCEEGVFLRKIKLFQNNGIDYLFVVGTKNKMAYVAIYQKINNTDYTPEPISTCFPSSSSPNDFTIVESEQGRFVIIVNTDNSISFCKLDENMEFTVLKEEYKTVDGQPLCVSSKGNMILVGLLNGKILKITASDDGFKYSDFAFTHANLYSTSSVDISECDIDIQDKESFIAQLKDYFSI